MDNVFYYRRENGDWVFSIIDSIGLRHTVIKDEATGNQYFLMLTHTKREMRKLYLDIPEDFLIIQQTFFTASYWMNTTWQQEYTK